MLMIISFFVTAFNSMDNGFLSFNHVRIPRTNMPMRFVQVTRDGKYVKMAKDSNRIAYITMMQVTGGNECMYLVSYG